MNLYHVLSWQIQNGFIQIRYNLGNGVQVLRISFVQVADSIPHTVEITRTEGSLELLLDNSYIGRGTTPGDVLLEIMSVHIYLGAEVNVTTRKVVQGFTGCLTGVRLDRMEFPLATNDDGNEHFKILYFSSDNILSGCQRGKLVENNRSSLYIFGGLGGILAILVLISIVFVIVCTVSSSWLRSRHGEVAIHRNGSSRANSPFSWQPALGTQSQDEQKFHSINKIKRTDFNMNNFNIVEGRDGQMNGREVIETETTFTGHAMAVHNPTNSRRGSQTTSRQNSRQSSRNQSVSPPVEGFNTVNQANQGFSQDTSTEESDTEVSGGRFIRQMKSLSAGRQSVRSNDTDRSDVTHIPSEIIGLNDTEVSKYLRKVVEAADVKNEEYDLDVMQHFKEEGPFEPLGSIGSLYDIVTEDLDSSVLSSVVSPLHVPATDTMVEAPSLKSPTSKCPTEAQSSRTHTNYAQSSPPAKQSDHSSQSQFHPQTQSTQLSPPATYFQLPPPGQENRPLHPPQANTTSSPSSPPPVLPPPGQLTKPFTQQQKVSRIHANKDHTNFPEQKWLPPPKQVQTNPSPKHRNQLSEVQTSSEFKPQNGTWLLSTSASQPDPEQGDITDLKLGTPQKLRRSARGANRVNTKETVGNIMEKFHNITTGTGHLSTKEASKVL